MSLKYHAQPESPHRYRLDPVGGMRCPVICFASQDIYDASDEDAWQQAYANACLPGVEAVYLMPDFHAGYFIPVGGVVVTDGIIIPSGSGYDINCGVLSLQVVGLHAAALADPAVRLRWIRAVEERVAAGLGSHQPDRMHKVTSATIEEVVRHGAQALGVSPDLCERSHFPVEEAHFDAHRVERAWEKAVPQLGGLGGGNHFIELQVDPTDASVWIMVHCGSRGYGWQTAHHYFHEAGLHCGLPSNRRDEAILRVGEPLAAEYWAHHNSAANYAVANRFQIVHGLRGATQEVFGHDIAPFFEISHNLVQQERVRQPDGSWAPRFVHRKGATRAMPAGHPDLAGSAWRETGHPCLIPGSMLTGAAVLFPEEGASQSACSVNHGSGRLMGRGHAKRELRVLQDDIDDEMRDTALTCDDGTRIEGIVINTAQTPLDECGHVYKDLDSVLEVLTENGIARISRRMRPVASIKGTD